jgi:hypothetical protein
VSTLSKQLPNGTGNESSVQSDSGQRKYDEEDSEPNMQVLKNQILHCLVSQIQDKQRYGCDGSHGECEYARRWQHLF